MAPPSWPTGKKGGAQIIQFPGKPATGPVDAATPSSVTSVPPSRDPSSPGAPRPSFHNFTDFTEFEAIFAGRNPSQSVGGYGKIQLYLEILANPLANGGYEAHFVRDNQTCNIIQEKPGDPIRVKFYRDPPSVLSGTNPHQIPKFQLTYYPDGELGHSARFDAEGQAQGETRIKETNLRSAALGAHETTLDFLRRRAQRLGEGREAFKRMEAPLQQLRPSSLDLAKRAAWYRNFVVVDGKVYSLRTQNFGFGALEQYPSQNVISIFEDQGARNVELFHLSQTGEINYLGEGTARRPPDPQQSALIDRLSHQLERAQADPSLYQRQLHGTLAGLEKSLSAKFERPEIAQTPFRWSPNSEFRGALGEPMQTITNGRDLLRIIRPIWPQTWRWENPGNPEEVRYLRPKGEIRWAMFKEWLRWAGNAFWHKAINHVTNLKPQAGELKLHLLPDGSAELEIYRNFTKYFPDGTSLEERGRYNILRRSADKTVIDLGRIVKQIAVDQPDILHRPRAEQLKLASQTLTGSSVLPRSLEIQAVPPLPIHQLLTGTRGPQSASEALEAVRQLPQLMGLNAQVISDGGGIILPGMETRFEMTFPGSQPPTQMLIHQEAHTTGKRVVVNLWQGDNISTAVYDEGIFNQHESGRLNSAEVFRARQGTLQKRWYQYIGPGAAQLRTYFEIHCPAFILGYVSSIPAAWVYERLFWNQAQRDRIGTAFPLDAKSVKHEIGAAIAIMAPATTAALTVDGVFNYGGGLLGTAVDKFQKGISWREAYAHNSPRLMNPPPARFRPIPEPSLRLGSIRQAGHPWQTVGRSLKWGAPYVRSLLQRGVPLFVGLFALEGYRSLGKDWKFLDVITGNLPPDAKINWKNIQNNFYHVGTVSLGSAALTNLAARRAELAVARRAAGQSIRGLGGFLLRNKLLAKAPKGMTGAYAMTWRASLLTVAAEMAVLGIWDSYERKQNLVHQERGLRSDLSRSMDRYNRILSRLQYGEEISPRRLQEAETEARVYYEQYRDYLKLMERDKGSAGHIPLGLEDNYSETYYAMERDRWMQTNDPALSQWEHQNKLQGMRRADAETEQRIALLYRSHGLSVEDPPHDPGLREFLARTTQVLQKDPAALDKALKPEPAASQPNSSASAERRALDEHLSHQAAPSPETMEKIVEEERRILAEAGTDNRYLKKLEAGLAANGIALEAQMEDYFKRTSDKRDQALLQFLPEEILAAHSIPPAAEML